MGCATIEEINRLQYPFTNFERVIKVIVSKNMAESGKVQKFEFIVSTPSHDAAVQPDKQTLVRQHVMRRFTKDKKRPRAVVLHGARLVEYLARRTQSGRSILPASGEPSPAKMCFIDTFLADQAQANMTACTYTGSLTDAATLLGAARPDPFAKYPIRMGSKEFDLVHHSMQPLHVPAAVILTIVFSLGIPSGRLSAVSRLLVRPGHDGCSRDAQRDCQRSPP